MLLLVGAVIVCASTAIGLYATRTSDSQSVPAGASSQLASDQGTSNSASHLQHLLALDDASLGRLDPLEVDLSVARTIPGCESLDVARYKRTVDEWAERVREETDRHLYKFNQRPDEYKNSLAYFKALAMVTVVGQDFDVGYHVESIAFDDPRDLFVHGVLETKRGTCVSLPVLYMAIGHRLGYPIRAVTVPRHMFCRWDDPKTGERFNIEAANAGGLADYPDGHYRGWPTKLDPRDVETGGALKTLTMREFLGVKIAARGDYYWHKGQKPEGQVSYALAHQLYPASRSIYEILASQILSESERYPWSPLNRKPATGPRITRKNTTRPADGGAS